MSLPTGAEVEFTVARVEHKRDLPGKPAENGKPALPPKVVLKLGLVSADGTKGWAEAFAEKDPATWPKEGAKETYILTQPDNPEWLPKASKPRSGGGGFRGRSPADTKAIQRQHSQEMALRAISLLSEPPYEAPELLRRNVKDWTDWFEADISGG